MSLSARLALLALLASAVVPTTAGGAPALSGSYRLETTRGDDVAAAIERAIAPMSFAVRPFARRRLQQITTPYPRLDIGATAEAVEIVADPRAPVRMPTDGGIVAWRREDGEPFDVRGRWDGPSFVQTFASGSGVRVNHYRLHADGETLTIDVRISGGGLPDALTFHLVYGRVG